MTKPILRYDLSGFVYYYYFNEEDKIGPSTSVWMVPPITPPNKYWKLK